MLTRDTRGTETAIVSIAVIFTTHTPPWGFLKQFVLLVRLVSLSQPDSSCRKHRLARGTHGNFSAADRSTRSPCRAQGRHRAPFFLARRGCRFDLVVGHATSATIDQCP